MAAQMSAQETTTALTDLLNSLHTHLQTQTQLLPTLHSQLGLPSSALEDDLRALREELVKGVEKQVETRRKEVEEWMTRCDVVEHECVRYTKALGGNVKSTGNTVGELRKDPVLPRRYKLVSEHQEKLRQLYHSKLEQLTTIMNRLHSLARTLGPTYFSMDVIELSTAPGENVLDPESHRDVSSERFLKLEKELVRGKAEVAHRLLELGRMFMQIDWLYSELGISPPTLDNLGSGSSSPSSNFTSVSSSKSVSPVSDPFLSTPTPFSRASTSSLRRDESSEIEHRRTFARFIARLEEADDEDLSENRNPPFGLENVEPNPGLLSWAKGLHASLEDLKRRRESHIQSIYDQLERLWQRLGVDEASIDAFVEKHRGSTEEVVREYEEELERMLEIKRGRMGTFIDSARKEIITLWDYLMIGDDERADFAPFVDDEYTEELLTIHEDEIRRLKEERRLKAPLLASIRKYFDICEEEKELAMAAADQTRLLGRGPRDPGRLLREEKMRKRVSKEKPRLEQDLLASIPAWEQETGRPFLVHGESILSTLMEAAAAVDQENKRRPPRAGSVPPRATTPVNSSNSNGHAPGSRAVTPAVRPSSSASQSVPNKRQKLNDGHKSTRAPLGNHRGNNAQRRPEPPTKTPGTVHKTNTITKPRTLQRTLGHGRTPSTTAYSSGLRSVSAEVKGSSIPAFGRSHNASKSLPGASPAVLRKASRAKRESFKPRPSEDPTNIGACGGIGKSRWGGTFTGSLKEEEDEHI